MAQPSQSVKAAVSKEDEFLEKGKRALAQQEYDMALQYFRQVVKQHPEVEEYRNLLSRAELEKAKSQVNVFTRPLFTLWAILLVYVLRLHKAGLGVARVLAKSRPGSKLATGLYASCCLKTSQMDEAIQTYESFLRESPFDEWALQKLSHIYYDRQDFVNAVRTLDVLRKLRPEDPEIQKMYDVAVTQKYTAEGTDVKKLERIEEERKKVEAQRPAIDENKVKILIQQCQENPQDINLRLRLGRMLSKGQLYEQAAGVLEEALALNGNHVQILEELTEVYDRLERSEEADLLLERLSRLKPGDPEIKKRILDRKIARSQKAVPITTGETATVQGPKPEELERLKQERLELDIQEYREKVKNNPGNPDFAIALGKLLRQKGEIDEAIANFQQAARNPTRAFIATKLLGETFYEKGMHDLAIAQLRKAMERAPSRRDFMTTELKEIHYLLSRIHEDLGELDQAIEYMKPIYEEDLNFKDVRERFEQLYQKRRKQKGDTAEKGVEGENA